MGFTTHVCPTKAVTQFSQMENMRPGPRLREVTVRDRIVLALGACTLAFASSTILAEESQQRSLEDFLTNPVSGQGALLQPPPPSPLLESVFKGCEDDFGPPATFGSPRERIEDTRATGSRRVFAGVAESTQYDMAQSDPMEDCASRIDGLWVELGSGPSFDTQFKTPGWSYEEESPESKGMTHGVYTQPSYLVIEYTDDPNRQLVVQEPFLDAGKVTFAAADSIGLEQALSNRSLAKRYRASRSVGELGNDLAVRAVSNGTVMIVLGGKRFVRPKTRLSKAERAAQSPMDDAFNREAIIQHVNVMTKGFDVTTQDPNRFGQNDKGFVFAQRTGTDYYTSERKIVPIDLHLDLLGEQDSIYFSSLLSSATEIQSAYASSFGVSAQVGISGSASNKSNTRSVNLEASVGYGSSFSNSQFSSLQERSSVSQAVGFTRQKQFALIRNHAQSELDVFFRDAVVSAVQNGNFDRIIRSYGTHYSYAATYGSSGQVRHTTTSEGYRELVGGSSSDSKSGSANLLIAQANASSSSARQSSSGFETSTEFGRAYFNAVGGNGSWNETGFAAGSTAYPILMDMRPLDELLNPINFPGQPAVYNQGRKRLARAIDDYLAEAGRRVSNQSLLPEIPPEEIQTWRIHSRWLRCTFAGDDTISVNPRQVIEAQQPGGVVIKAQLRGWIKLQSIQQPAGHQQTRAVYPFHAIDGVARDVSCLNDKNSRGNTRTMRAHNDYLLVRGTSAEIRKYVFRYRAEIAEVDGGINPDDAINANSPNLLIPAKADSKVGDYYTRVWDLPHPSGRHARLHVNTRIERVK